MKTPSTNTPTRVHAVENLLRAFSHFALLIIHLVIITPSFGQDYILTKHGELLKVSILKNESDLLTYKLNDLFYSISKSEVQNFSIQNRTRKRPSKVEIVDHQGSHRSGSLLYATLDSLYIWRGSKTYHPNEGNFFAISMNEVDGIAIHRNGSFGNGFKIGAFIGGTLGVIGGLDLGGFLTGSPGGDVLLSAAVTGAAGGLLGGLVGSVSGNHIQLDSLNQNQLATTLPAIQNNALLATPPIRQVNKNQADFDWSHEGESIFKPTKNHNQSKLTLCFHGGFEILSAQRSSMKNSIKNSGHGGTVNNWIWGGSTSYPVRENGAFFMDLGIEIPLQKSSQLAFIYNWTSRFGARGITGETEVGKKKAFEVYYQFVPKRYVPLATSKWESSVGIGPTINFLETEIKSYGATMQIEETTKAGLAGQASWDYYLTPKLSFVIRFSCKIIPGMQIQESVEIKEHKVNFSSFDLGIGIKTHL